MRRGFFLPMRGEPGLCAEVSSYPWEESLVYAQRPLSPSWEESLVYAQRPLSHLREESLVYAQRPLSLGYILVYMPPWCIWRYTRVICLPGVY